MSKFVPCRVIFANGKDDDTPGIIAAIRNERVAYGEHVYEPGDPLRVDNVALRLTRPIAVVSPDGGLIGGLGLNLSPHHIVVCPPAGSPRRTQITSCDVFIG